MKNIFTYLFIGLLCLVLAGCDSYLDIQKHGNMGSMDDFYKTDEDAEQAAAAMYTQLNGQCYNYFFVKNMLSDDCWAGGGSRGDNAEIEKINEYTFDTDHSMVNGMYSGMYTVIYYANLILDKLDSDTPFKAMVRAEARFFRAWAHFELVTLWGTAPIVDHLLSQDEYRQGNGDPEKTWAFIEEDLLEAINSGDLSSKSGVNDEEGTIRVTKEVAEALLGKAYLFQEKYSEAAEMLDRVIDSGLYALWDGDYGLILHTEANNSCESMLAVQLRNDADMIWWMCNWIWVMVGWRTENFSFTSPALEEISMNTWGFGCPTKSLYDAFVEREGADGYRLMNTMRSVTWLEENYGMTLTAGKYLMGCEGYLTWKYRARSADVVYDNTGFQALQYCNFSYMRYAEVLLLAAEAQYMNGNNSKATNYVNQIRTRAQLPTLGSVTLDDIKIEKRLELCMECTRFQDLVRWGDAASVLGNQGKDIPVYTTEGTQWLYSNTTYGFKAGKNELLPIPQQELELNPNMHQNVGW